MKNVLVLYLILLPSLCMAFQCPLYSDFYQDKNMVWHLTKVPPAPAGTFWEPLHQGPLAPKNHKVNSIDVSLTYGTWQDRVNCDYGKNGNIFMGVSLHVSQNQKPMPGLGSSFEGDIPNDCFISPEACQFEIKE